MVSLWPSSSLGHLLGKLPPELKCHFSLHFGYISVMSHGFYRRPGIEASFRLASGHTVPSRDASQPGSLWSTAQKTPPLRAVVSECVSSLFAPPCPCFVPWCPTWPAFHSICCHPPTPLPTNSTMGEGRGIHVDPTASVDWRRGVDPCSEK